MRRPFGSRRQFIPVADLAYEQFEQYQRVGAFLLGCIEREHLLNVDALASYWLRLGGAWTNPLAGRNAASGDARPRALAAPPPTTTEAESEAGGQMPALCSHQLPASSCPA